MKIITICGSLKFQNEMKQIAEEMELKGHCILPVIYPTKSDKNAYTEEELKMFDKMHKEKIKLSNAILVVDLNGYIGNSTQNEIEFAKSLDKEILYYSDLSSGKP